jgi:hypothetical protein
MSKKNEGLHTLSHFLRWHYPDQVIRELSQPSGDNSPDLAPLVTQINLNIYDLHDPKAHVNKKSNSHAFFGKNLV